MPRKKPDNPVTDTTPSQKLAEDLQPFNPAQKSILLNLYRDCINLPGTRKYLIRTLGFTQEEVDQMSQSNPNAIKTIARKS